MKYRLVTKLSILFLFVFQIVVFAQNFPEKPNPPRLVNDFAGMLDAQEINALERKLVTFNDSTSNQISIVTVNNLDGYPISDYAFELGAKWGIGVKDKNNGILIVISKEDRKGFIAVGYGLEAVVPDVTAKLIYDKYIKKNFKAGNYYQGFDESTDILIGLTKGEFTADAVGKKGKVSGWTIFIILLVLLLIFYSKYRSVKGSHYGSSDLSFFQILMLMNMSGGGGRSGGGSWGGGSDSGGGFGGFGGGDFGGGGAGGDW